MKLKLSELKQNPFKKFINDGKLSDDRVELLQESIEHGTLPENFFVRNNNEIYELTSGHHRVEALKRSKGKDYEVTVNVVNYNDEQMLIDMVRENLTQRDTDYHDTSESIVLARGWLQSGTNTVKQFNSEFKSGKHIKGLHGTEPQEDSYRSVAKFLSKKGKAVCYVTVKNYLDINDKVDETIKNKIKKFKGMEDTNDAVTFKQALALSKIEDKKEQKELLEAMQKNKEEEGGRPHELISKYKEAPEEIKEKVRKGELNFNDIENETEVTKLKQKIDEGKSEKDQQIQIVRSKEIVDSLRSEIIDTHKMLDSLMYKVRIIRRKGFGWYSSSSKKDFGKLVSNVLDKVDKWRDELLEIKKEIGD